MVTDLLMADLIEFFYIILHDLSEASTALVSIRRHLYGVMCTDRRPISLPHETTNHADEREKMANVKKK